MFKFDPHRRDSIKILIGAGEQKYDGWISTHKEELNLLDANDWLESFNSVKADAFICEHVWEHLSLEEGQEAAKYVYGALKPGGFIRVAVPDGNFLDDEYQKTVQVGGPGPSDHPVFSRPIRVL